MAGQEPKGPSCQSCGMPLEQPEDCGSARKGLRVNDFCHYCFQDGAFTEPEISMQEMIDKCVRVMVREEIMPEPQARALMAEVIPRLKRWQTA
jgi:hypothetical protein